jgi:hypothetical protein
LPLPCSPAVFLAPYPVPPRLQAHLVLALAGATSAYVTVARPTLSHRKGGPHASPPATLYEAGTSPALPSAVLAALRGLLAAYIFAMGGAQISRLGTFVFKFYTIWNWWLLGLYFALAALASVTCARKEAAAAKAASGSGQVAAPAAKAVAAAAAGPLVGLQRSTALSRSCHALFMINCSTVIIVDVVCWAVLYPMLSRGPQTPEVERIIR